MASDFMQHGPSDKVEAASPRRFGTAVPLSTGGTAEVFKAWDETLQRPVALKFLRTGDPSLVERMFREARAQARLDHPGICKVYDIGELDGRPYIAMQFIDGVEIGDLIPELELKEKVHLLCQVARAIHYAHREGLIHRDLKPANIMVQRDDEGTYQPIVVDFGLVWEPEDQGTAMTQEGQLLGTPPYLAPEQVEGRHELLDRRTDVYSLGATLYHLITGRPPFEGERDVDLLIQVLHEDPIRPRRLDPAIPVDLETVILKCLAKERSRRYESARRLAEDLERFLRGESITARPPSLTYRLRRKAKRHRVPLAIAALFLTAAVVSLAIMRGRAEARLGYEQRYSQIGRDLDWSLRAVYMSSRHDIRSSKERVRQRIREVEAELDDIGSLGRGPAHLAIGRAYAALNQDEAARQHLETAWTMGQRNPEVGYTLGLVLGRQYEARLQQVRYLRDTSLREEAMTKLKESLRDPAIRYLEAGRGTDAVAAEYVEGLLAFYERRFDEALQLLETARTKLPWFYETLILKGHVLNALGDEKRVEGADPEGSREPYGLAEEAYHAAIASAGSDPRAYLGLCQLRTNLLRLELQRPTEVIQARREQAFEACNDALTIDQELPRAHILGANLGVLWSRHLMWTGGDPEPFLSPALASAEQAVSLDADNASAHAAVGSVFTMKAEYLNLVRTDDPRPDLAKGIESFQRALDLSPGNPDFLNRSGTLWSMKGLYESRQGLTEDSRVSNERSVSILEEAAAASPRSFAIQYNLANTLDTVCQLMADEGGDFGPCLERLDSLYRRAVELNPQFDWGHLVVGSVASRRADYLFFTGEDPQPALQEAESWFEKAVELNPEVSEFHFRWCFLDYQRAYMALLDGEAVAPHLQAARERSARAYEIRPDPLGYHSRGLLLHTMSLREALRNGTKTNALVRQADIHLEKLLEIDYRDAWVYSVAIDYLLWRSYGEVIQGRRPKQHLDRGETLIREGLEAGLIPANLTGMRGGFRLLRSRSSRDPETREKLEREAERDFRSALDLNRWLAKEIEPWLAEVDSNLDRKLRLSALGG